MSMTDVLKTMLMKTYSQEIHSNLQKYISKNSSEINTSVKLKKISKAAEFKLNSIFFIHITNITAANEIIYFEILINAHIKVFGEATNKLSNKVPDKVNDLNSQHEEINQRYQLNCRAVLKDAEISDFLIEQIKLYEDIEIPNNIFIYSKWETADMRFSNELVPFLGREEIEAEAERFLKKYSPAALNEQMPVDIEEIIELKMGLDIDYVNITRNCSILGMMMFGDGVAAVYDKDTKKYMMQEFSKGTMLIEDDLYASGKNYRGRFTMTHEASHWDVHQLRFAAVSYKDKTSGMVCRCPNKKLLSPKTPEEWIEWQADNLAGAILMPKEPFSEKVEELKEEYGITKEFVKFGVNSKYYREILEGMLISKISNFFQVSKSAVRVRIKQLDLFDQISSPRNHIYLPM